MHSRADNRGSCRATPPISFIRDYRYAHYVVDDAELVFAPCARTSGRRIASAMRLIDCPPERGLDLASAWR